MTSNAALPTHPAGLRARVEEARARLSPEGPVIPAPRNPGGIEVPMMFGGPGAAPRAIVTALDDLATRLTVVEAEPDVAAHHALARIGALTSAGVPDEGWSADEDISSDTLVEAAAVAAELHEQAAVLLASLDEAGLSSPAAVIDALSTSLRVIRMVADLEVFAVTRG